MALLTPTQAATRLNRTERTVRRWINNGMLTATHPTHGRKDKFLIEESEVERLASELAKEQPEQQKQPAASELDQQAMNVFIANMAARLAKVEDSLRAAEQKIATLETQLSVGTPNQPATEHTTRTRTPRASATTDTYEPIIAPLENLPQGSMPYRDFAKRHGVKPRTFLDHIIKGHVAALERDIPNRPKEKARWLTPEQQRQAIRYWQEINTPYDECLLCPHSDEIYQRASQDQQSAEDQEKPTA